MERPSLKLTIGDHEIRWTYGLQQDMQRLFPEATRVIHILLEDPYTRDYVVRRALTPVKKLVEKDEDLIAVEDLDIDPDQALEIQEWVTSHILYFFTKSASTMARLGESMKLSLPQLPPSTSGSEPSV